MKIDTTIRRSLWITLYDVNVNIVHDEDNVVDLEITNPDGNSFHVNVDDLEGGNTGELIDYYDDIKVGLKHEEDTNMENDR